MQSIQPFIIRIWFDSKDFFSSGYCTVDQLKEYFGAIQVPLIHWPSSPQEFTYTFIFEHCNLYDLNYCLSLPAFDFQTRLTCLHHAIEALYYFHQVANIVHRDFKTDNIFVQCNHSTQKITGKLVDFGYCGSLVDVAYQQASTQLHLGCQLFQHPKLYAQKHPRSNKYILFPDLARINLLVWERLEG